MHRSLSIVADYPTQRSQSRPIAIALGVLLLLLLTISLPAQTPAFATGPRLILSGTGNWTSPLEISRDYQSDGTNNDITAVASPGYEGRFTFLSPLKNNWTVQGSIGVGVYSHKIELKLSDDFRFLGWGGFDDYFTEYDLFYLGYSFGAGYIVPLSNRSRLDLRLNAQLIYFFRESTDYGVSAVPDDNISRLLYLSSTETNPNRQLVIAPELQLIYAFRLSQSFDLEIGLHGVWSNVAVFKTNEGYSVVGDQEVRTGSFSKNYSHVGASIGLAYTLYDSPPIVKKEKE
ncbi:MAG: hypothetical protein KDC44_15565 [Phaeodactylibacter sp.]|nr:hypothetical protein [Phaeodactylibacter sp.]